MSKSYISISDVISISNPSDLVLDVDDYLLMSKKRPSVDPLLIEKETNIFNDLKKRSQMSFPGIILFSPNLSKIEDDINTKYEDGFYFDDDFGIETPYDRTLRTRQAPLEEPTLTKDLSERRATTITLVNPNIIEGKSAALNRYTSSLLTIETPSYEETHHIR